MDIFQVSALTPEERTRLAERLTCIPCETNCHLWTHLEKLLVQSDSSIMQSFVTPEILFDAIENLPFGAKRCLGCLEEIADNVNW